MPLSPPICLEVMFTNVRSTLSDPNLYTATLTTPGQGYSGGNSFYMATDIAVGMWTSNSSSGYAFRIQSVSNVTSASVDVILEDVGGTNALIDPTGVGGGPSDGVSGFIFELNSKGLPILSSADKAPNWVWTDSQLARFLYYQTGSTGTSPTGNTGPTGPRGADGTATNTGATGPTGDKGPTGERGLDGNATLTGATGPTGPRGLDGNATLTGATGPRGLGLPFVFTPSVTARGNMRTLTGFIENDVTYSVRSADLTGSILHIVLASFSPLFTLAGLPSSSLSWDQPATGFSVAVTNPADYIAEYISSVYSITPSAGTVSALSNFTAGAKTSTPAGGVSWNQSFTTNALAVIQPASTSITGGSVVAAVQFNSGALGTPYTVTIPNLTISWATPSLSVSVSALSGKTFLETYSSTPYTVNVSGIQNSSNYANTVSATIGSVSNATGNGTYTFAAPIHKNNTSQIGTVSASTTFTRPSTVTGASYTSQLTASSSTSATFSYPSFWVFTSSTSNPPVSSDIVSGTSFTATQLGNQASSFAGFVLNSAGTPQAFWLGVRSSASQPSTFKSGDSVSLLTGVAVKTGNSVSLSPTPTPSGYSPESYTLYGIILQAGTTYVSIS
jgi:hypothetical protein